MKELGEVNVKLTMKRLTVYEGRNKWAARVQNVPGSRQLRRNWTSDYLRELACRMPSSATGAI